MCNVHSRSRARNATSAPGSRNLNIARSAGPQWILRSETLRKLISRARFDDHGISEKFMVFMKNLKFCHHMTKVKLTKTFHHKFSGSSPLQNLKLQHENWDWTTGNQISQDKISHTSQKSDQNLLIVTSHDSSKLPAGD